MIRSWLRPWLLALAVGLGLVGAAPTLAQADQDEQAEAGEAVDPSEDRATAFRAVTGPQAEQVPGGTLLISAYALVWIFVLLFVLRLAKLHGQTRTDLERLERGLYQGDADAAEATD